MSIIDLQKAIDTSVMVTIDYLSMGNVASFDRLAAPLEIRLDDLYIWDIRKDALRKLKIARISSVKLTNQKFDPLSFS